LIEILVSILLLSFGMLALAGMQAYSVAAQKHAANRAIASSLANELAEIIRLNPGSAVVPYTGFAAGNYDVTMMPTDNPPTLAPCVFPLCNTPALLAAADLKSFQNRVRAQLPLGGVELSRPVGAGVLREANIWIVWEEAGVLANTRTVGAVTSSAEKLADNCSATAKALATLPRCFYMKVQL
jgi:type IV pilus assembly protein PilV